MKMQVVLHEDCLKNGGENEYPHLATVSTNGVAIDRLVYCKLGKPFFGKSGRNGKKQRKTDKRHGMFIPEWLLVPVRE